MTVGFSITYIAVTVVFALGCLKLMWDYMLDEDKPIKQSLLIKIVILVGLALMWLLVSLLPIDVDNTRPSAGILNMRAFWITVFVMIAVYLVIPLPFTSAWYQADTDSRVTTQKPIIQAVIWATATLVVSAAVVVSLFFALSYATIPVKKYECEQFADALSAATVCDTKTSSSLRIGVSFFVFMMSLMIFLGWWLFVMFGGVGLMALPIDLIIAFVDRPTARDLANMQAHQEDIGKRAVQLTKVAEELKEKEGHLSESSTGWWSSLTQKRTLVRDFRKFKADFYQLEQDAAWLQVVRTQGANPLVTTVSLILGILCCIMTFTWLLHIIVYMLARKNGGWVPVNLMLNNMLIGMENTGFSLLAVVFFCLLIFYLMLCVVKGCLKFGLRLFIVPIHPFKKGDTPLSSFLFNVGMLLLAAVAIVHFCTDAFADYIRLSGAHHIFGIQIKYMDFFKYFFYYRVFTIILLTWSLIAMIFLAVWPRDNVKNLLKRGPKPKSGELADKLSKIMAKKVGKSADKAEKTDTPEKTPEKAKKKKGAKGAQSTGMEGP
eukprot:Platyproteum_vivax@DN6926_c0_g1_i3.p1